MYCASVEKPSAESVTSGWLEPPQPRTRPRPRASTCRASARRGPGRACAPSSALGPVPAVLDADHRGPARDVERHEHVGLVDVRAELARDHLVRRDRPPAARGGQARPGLSRDRRRRSLRACRRGEHQHGQSREGGGRSAKHRASLCPAGSGPPGPTAPLAHAPQVLGVQPPLRPARPSLGQRRPLLAAAGARPGSPRPRRGSAGRSRGRAASRGRAPRSPPPRRAPPAGPGSRGTRRASRLGDHRQLDVREVVACHEQAEAAREDRTPSAVWPSAGAARARHRPDRPARARGGPARRPG